MTRNNLDFLKQWILLVAKVSFFLQSCLVIKLPLHDILLWFYLSSCGLILVKSFETQHLMSNPVLFSVVNNQVLFPFSFIAKWMYFSPVFQNRNRGSCVWDLSRQMLKFCFTLSLRSAFLLFNGTLHVTISRWLLLPRYYLTKITLPVRNTIAWIKACMKNWCYYLSIPQNNFLKDSALWTQKDWSKEKEDITCIDHVQSRAELNGWLHVVWVYTRSPSFQKLYHWQNRFFIEDTIILLYVCRHASLLF